MAENTSICAVCDKRYISRPSTDWCPVCEEALCQDCKEHHTVQKATHGHELISMTEYLKLPPVITELKQYCGDHEEIFQLFCKTHDFAICNKCIRVHGQSCDVIPLEEAIRGVKYSEAFQDIVMTLEDLEKDVALVKRKKETNVIEISDERKKIEEELLIVLKEAIDHLELLGENMMSNLRNMESKATRKLKYVLNAVDERRREILEYRSIMSKMKESASDIQTFMGMKEVHRKLANHEAFLQALKEGPDLDHIELICTFNEVIRIFCTDVTCLGSVELKSHPIELKEFKWQNNKLAQILAPLSERFNSITLTKCQKIDVGDKSNSIRGCCIKESGDFLFSCDAEGELIHTKNDGLLNWKLSMKPASAFDVALLNDKTAMVTSGYTLYAKPGINLVDLDSQKIIKFIELPGKPYGMSLNDDSLFVCISFTGMQLINRKTLELSSVIRCQLPGFSYVAMSNGCIYYTNYGKSIVTCCDSTGNIKWKFQKENVLKGPTGIVVDNYRNVFVSGQRSGNVLIISPNGKKYRELLTRNDGLIEPSAMCFDTSKSKLLIVNLSSAAYLFELN